MDFDTLNFKELFECAPVGLLVLNSKLFIVAVSDAYLESTLATRDSVIGKYLFEAFPDNPEEKGATGVRNLKSSLDRVLQTGTSHTMAIQKYDVPRPASQGGGFAERYWSPKNSPVKNSQGEVSFIIHRVEDVTCFVKTEIQQNQVVEAYKEKTIQSQAECYHRSLELQHTNNLFFSIINATTDIVAAVDNELCYTVVNKSFQNEFQRRFGRRVGNGMNVKDVFAQHKNELNQQLLIWQNVLKGEHVTVTERYREEGCFEILYFPIYDDKHQTIGAGLMGRNISERLALTASLKKAENTNTLRTEFFTNISHEFRTPLTLMLGPLESSLNDGSPLSAELQRQMYRNGCRLLKLVNSLLDFSRLEANQVRVIYEPTNLSQFTADLASTFRSAIERANVNFVVNTTSFNEPIYLDREMWEKIVLNLLSNALKYTPKGSITVTLTRQNNCAELRVQDTGVGIPEKDLPHIFDRFHRAENSKRSVEGTGIGLSLVKELLKLMGGSIRVESVVLQGSTFIVTLPTQKPGLPQLDSNVNSHTEEKKENEQQSKETILIVDDHEDMRNYVKQLLQRYWNIEIAADGEEALHKMRTLKPSLVLTDLMMPKMDGFQLINTMQQDEELKSVPVIILSARSAEDARVQGIQLGADYISKPFSRKELVARIWSHLESSHSRKELEYQIQLRTQELHKVQDAFQQQTLDKLEAEKRFAVEQAQIAKDHKQQLEEFMDTLCHEIRNPLSAVFGLVSLMQDTQKQFKESINQDIVQANPSIGKMISKMLDELLQPVSLIEQCAQQQKVILDDVLDLSKLENNISLEPEPFHPKILLDQLIQRYRGLFEQKQLKWEISVTDEADSVFQADTRRLSQVLMNIVGNAVKFTSVGGIRAEVSWEHQRSDEGMLHFSITDSGVGMSSEELTRLFKRFSQVGEQKHSHKGTGLGLYISKKLVTLMGGSLQCNSTKGEGTRFYFGIRCTKLPGCWQLSAAQNTPQEDKISSLKILIVEDNQLNQTILKRYLQEKKCDCLIANNGQEALNLFDTQNFDGIFMDVEMPVMDGLEATKKIREIELNLGDGNHIPIIGLSGNARPEHREVALKAGMDSYLTKPFHKQDLYKIIREFFGTEHKMESPGENMDGKSKRGREGLDGQTRKKQKF